MILSWENQSTRRETCPNRITAWPTSNPVWADPRSNRDLGGERPVANRLSRGPAWSE
jgi:hypothetical protein